MKPDRSWIDALRGDAFSSSADFPIIDSRKYVPLRLDEVAERVQGRSVVHVGCVDHEGLIGQKIESGMWLHKRLSDVASKCVGVDINESGIARLVQEGWADVFVGDITRPDTFVDPGTAWDVIVLGEIVEHVDNPVAFLAAIREAWAGRCNRLILTLPNAFAWSTLRSTGRSVESINTDHRYWFTPYTAAKVATQAGFIVNDIALCENYPENPSAGPASRSKQRLLRSVLIRRPLWRSSVVIDLEAAPEPERVTGSNA
jgi:hypothetical protein